MKTTIKAVESVYNWVTGISMVITLICCIAIVNTAELKPLLIELTGIILLLTHVPKNKVEVYKFFKGLEEMEEIKNAEAENEKIQ